MKIFQILFIMFLLFNAGCESSFTPRDNTGNIEDESAVYLQYAPVKIDIMPLTEFVGASQTRQSQIEVYVGLLDSFGSQIKSPGLFRFELYQKAGPSSPDPKGKRVEFWPPDLDLTSLAENDRFWHDYLRAYKFLLPFNPIGSQEYVLEVTYICPISMCPSGKYLIDDFTLNVNTQ